MNQVPAAVGCITFIVLLVLFFFWLRIRLEDDNVIEQIADGKEPIRFSRRQLARYTNNYSARLGAGAFGTVYVGTLPNGLKVAVKKLHAGVDWRSKAEFVADVVGTLWRARHTNLVRLVGYCYDVDTTSDVPVEVATVRGVVCEYMERGALDTFLDEAAGGSRLPALINLRLRSLTLGVARGIQYLHDGCQHKIVHYGIKPSNVLLDGELTPKIADFGLAQLMTRPGGDAHAAAVSMQPPGVADKYDVYSFGKLVLQIVATLSRPLVDRRRRRRRNLLDEESEMSHQQQWFPRVTWTKYESGNLMDLVMDMTTTNGCRNAVVAAAVKEKEEKEDDDDDQQLQQRTLLETVERMCKVAFWCMQRHPDARPPMGVVVKMLEGDVDITPPPNPFTDLVWGDGEHEPTGIILSIDHQVRLEDEARKRQELVAQLEIERAAREAQEKRMTDMMQFMQNLRQQAGQAMPPSLFAPPPTPPAYTPSEVGSNNPTHAPRGDEAFPSPTTQFQG